MVRQILGPIKTTDNLWFERVRHLDNALHLRPFSQAIQAGDQAHPENNRLCPIFFDLYRGAFKKIAINSHGHPVFPIHA